VTEIKTNNIKVLSIPKEVLGHVVDKFMDQKDFDDIKSNNWIALEVEKLTTLNPAMDQTQEIIDEKAHELLKWIAKTENTSEEKTLNKLIEIKVLSEIDRLSFFWNTIENLQKYISEKYSN